MSLLGNIIWFLFGGFMIGLGYILWGVIFCITIVGFPFGYQLIRIGLFAMTPFGDEPAFEGKPMGCLSMCFNIIWILLGGIELALSHLVIGVLFCITIIGVPFGMQHFKLAKLALVPFGQRI